MKRPTRTVIAKQVVALLVLRCGHQVLADPDDPTPRRVHCPECYAEQQAPTPAPKWIGS